MIKIYHPLPMWLDISTALSTFCATVLRSLWHVAWESTHLTALWSPADVCSAQSPDCHPAMQCPSLSNRRLSVYAGLSQSRGRAASVFINTLACAVIVQQELVCLPLSFSLLTSILKPWMSGMPGSCDDRVARGNPGAFHSEQVTVKEVMRG